MHSFHAAWPEPTDTWLRVMLFSNPRPIACVVLTLLAMSAFMPMSSHAQWPDDARSATIDEAEAAWLVADAIRSQPENDDLFISEEEPVFTGVRDPNVPDTFAHRVNAPTTSLVRDRLVLEFGYSYTYDAYDEIVVEQHNTPDILLRYSVTDRLEARLGWPGWIGGEVRDELTGITETFDDISDPSVGLKYLLWRQERWMPRTLVLASAPIATEGSPLTLRNFQPTTGLIYGWNIGQRWMVSGGSSLAYWNDGDDDRWDYQQSLTADCQCFERVGFYTQYSALFPDGSQAAEHMLSGGAYWMVTPRWQLDLRVGGGLSRAAPDLVAGLNATFVF